MRRGEREKRERGGERENNRQPLLHGKSARGSSKTASASNREWQHRASERSSRKRERDKNRSRKIPSSKPLSSSTAFGHAIDTHTRGEVEIGRMQKEEGEREIPAFDNERWRRRLRISFEIQKPPSFSFSASNMAIIRDAECYRGKNRAPCLNLSLQTATARLHFIMRRSRNNSGRHQFQT